jgi:transposase-like protein
VPRYVFDNFGNDTTPPIPVDRSPRSAPRRIGSHPQIDRSCYGASYRRLAPQGYHTRFWSRPPCISGLANGGPGLNWVPCRSIVCFHFLLTAAARSLSLAQVARLSDEEAHAKFCEIRWSDNDGKPYCPKCGGLIVYPIPSRQTWQCSAKGCGKQFSVTSGTLFASRKRPIRDYLLAIAIFVNGAKGHSALQLSRDLNCQYKTAFVLAHKLREAVGAIVQDVNAPELSGEVHVDGMYTGGSKKPENRKAERVDRRLAEERTGKRQVVVVAREVGGRTLPFVVPRESAAVPLIRARVASGTVVHADELSAWDILHASYDTRRVNHSVEYVAEDGANVNQAESWFSRLRRAQYGIHHRISGPYLYQYSNEMAWREDNRRVPNGMQWRWMTGAALRHPKSEVWRGYWQRSATA